MSKKVEVHITFDMPTDDEDGFDIERFKDGLEEALYSELYVDDPYPTIDIFIDD